ncbi:hypothetical protein EX895_004415 [Sporisorium graminicola]|uniref:CBM1 domain-containing protein n=1 Tax=Sporisorium graminicola TaxID=280036 RepID=A0A4U7KQJ6_9BASI|nr:hypothetical protein EX895_004415 [Sporisorium graminicola]TKY86775.1 hypothetical protein EX895_004415 [Sporisorium graminicola]
MKNLNQLARVFVVVILCMAAMAIADKGSGARTCFQQTDCVLHGSICCEASSGNPQCFANKCPDGWEKTG